MLKTFLFLAQAPAPDLTDVEALRDTANQGRDNSLVNTDLVLVLGCILALAAVLFFWAFFVRQRPKHFRGSLVLTRAHRGEPGEAEPGRHRRRRRRPEHPDNWKRNPTLGETGGLPPVRVDEGPREEDPDPNQTGEAGRQSTEPG